MKVSNNFSFYETDMQTGWICLQNDLVADIYTQFRFILKVRTIGKQRYNPVIPATKSFM